MARAGNMDCSSLWHVSAYDCRLHVANMGTEPHLTSRPQTRLSFGLRVSGESRASAKHAATGPQGIGPDTARVIRGEEGTKLRWRPRVGDVIVIRGGAECGGWEGARG